MQASPDLAYGARVQSIGRLEENRRTKTIGVTVWYFEYIDIFSAFPKEVPKRATS